MNPEAAGGIDGRRSAAKQVQDDDRHQRSESGQRDPDERYDPDERCDPIGGEPLLPWFGSPLTTIGLRPGPGIAGGGLVGLVSG
ncbi:hypothetical protein ACFQE1_21570, partial [Halobium palmae]